MSKLHCKRLARLGLQSEQMACRMDKYGKHENPNLIPGTSGTVYILTTYNDDHIYPLYFCISQNVLSTICNMLHVLLHFQS